jgi:hypothetical protein
MSSPLGIFFEITHYFMETFLKNGSIIQTLPLENSNMGETFDTKIDIKYNSNLIIPLPYMSIFKFIIFLL